MRRRVAMLLVLSATFLGALVTPVAAQDSPPPPSVLPSSTVQGGAVPRTGAEVWPTVLFSIVLLAVGVALVLLARHRRRTLALT